jgi:hypothetical protein
VKIWQISAQIPDRVENCLPNRYVTLEKNQQGGFDPTLRHEADK